MFVKTLKSLVLRGSVRRDGQAVGARLGFSYLTPSQSPEVPVSMRHGDGLPVAGPEERRGRMPNPPVDNSALRAGRSVRLAGVLNRRTPTLPVGGTSFRWSPVLGGSIPAAAACTGRIATCLVASVGKTSPHVPPAAALFPTAFGSARLSLRPLARQSKQTARTIPVSTRGRHS